MDKHLVIERVGNIAAKVAVDTGVELVHVEIAGIKHDMVVRVYIDKPEGVTIDDCSRYLRRLRRSSMLRTSSRQNTFWKCRAPVSNASFIRWPIL